MVKQHKFKDYLNHGGPKKFVEKITRENKALEQRMAEKLGQSIPIEIYQSYYGE